MIAQAKEIRINEQISCPKLRLIDDQGQQLGIMRREEALRIAEERGLDLVEVAPGADPPVCRLIDYDKYRYQESKKAQQAKAKQKVTQVKEVKMRPVTGEDDYQVKIRNARKFLEAGDKVKFTVRFRGREITHPELGRAILERVEQDLKSEAMTEQMPKLEGKQLIMILAPAAKGKSESKAEAASAKA